MGIYNTFDYGDGTLYGDASKVAYSAAPLTATAIGSTTYNESFVIDRVGTTGLKEVIRPRVDLTWTNPTGSVFGFRLVRNQDGFSENEEDGQVLLETFSPVIPATTTFTDEMATIPLVEGRYAYYTIWLLLADFTWVIGAYTYCLVPKEHSIKTPEGNLYKTSERKFIETFPKVYTSEMQSYLDEVSETSDLRIFLGGFGYTLDETLTFTDLLVPDYSGKSTNPNMVELQAHQLGLPKEPTLSLQRKKALVRNAYSINKYRGNITSVSLLAKSLSGFAVTTRISPNLLLNSQDSSFYKGIGNWKISTNGVLTSNLTTGATDLPNQSETFAVDKSYTGKVVTSATNVTMSLGTADPRLTGVPVSPSQEYQLSYYIKDSGNNVTPYIKWFDATGTLIGSAVAGTTTAAGTTWAELTLKATSPSTAVFASIEFLFASAGTYYVDMIQFATTSDARYSTFYEARALEIFLEPTKVNYVKNPTMSSATGWTLSGATAVYTNNSTVPGIRLDNSKMTTMTTTASTSFSLATTTDAIITSGQYYTYSIYAATTSGTQNMDIKLEALDGTGSTMQTLSGAPVSRTITAQSVTSTWKRYSVSLFIPNSSDTISLKATLSGTGTGAVVNLDAAQIEVGYGTSDYFDGSYASRGAYWTSTANNSISVLYRSKAVKVNRMVFEIPNYLPMNKHFYITSGFNGTVNLEYSGISS